MFNFHVKIYWDCCGQVVSRVVEHRTLEQEVLGLIPYKSIGYILSCQVSIVSFLHYPNYTLDAAKYVTVKMDAKSYVI